MPFAIRILHMYGAVTIVIKWQDSRAANEELPLWVQATEPQGMWETFCVPIVVVGIVITAVHRCSRRRHEKAKVIIYSVAADKTLNRVCQCQHAPNNWKYAFSLIIAYIIVLLSQRTGTRTGAPCGRFTRTPMNHIESESCAIFGVR